MPSRTILTALELDIFSAVAKGATAEQVAGEIHANPRATEMLLNALVSLKLLQKREDTFLNTAASARFFPKARATMRVAGCCIRPTSGIAGQL